MQYITDLTELTRLGLIRENENLEFRTFLKIHFGSEELDDLVKPINEKVTAAVDCTQCGNCCRSLMINVTKEDAKRAAAHLQITNEEFDEQYIEKGAEAEKHEAEEGTMLMNTIPCHFLSDNKCTIYEARFEECREFPHTHKPGFQQRLFGMIMHYDRCPIVFNLMETLKDEVNFKRVV